MPLGKVADLRLRGQGQRSAKRSGVHSGRPSADAWERYPAAPTGLCLAPATAPGRPPGTGLGTCRGLALHAAPCDWWLWSRAWPQGRHVALLGMRAQAHGLCSAPSWPVIGSLGPRGGCSGAGARAAAAALPGAPLSPPWLPGVCCGKDEPGP